MAEPAVLVIARVHALAHAAAALAGACRELAAASRSAPGCTGYDVLLDADDPAEIVLVHGWADRASLRAHYGAGRVARWEAQAAGALARPSDVVIHAVSATSHPVGDLSADPGRAD